MDGFEGLVAQQQHLLDQATTYLEKRASLYRELAEQGERQRQDLADRVKEYQREIDAYRAARQTVGQNPT